MKLYTFILLIAFTQPSFAGTQSGGGGSTLARLLTYAQTYLESKLPLLPPVAMKFKEPGLNTWYEGAHKKLLPAVSALKFVPVPGNEPLVDTHFGNTTWIRLGQNDNEIEFKPNLDLFRKLTQQEPNLGTVVEYLLHEMGHILDLGEVDAWNFAKQIATNFAFGKDQLALPTPGSPRSFQETKWEYYGINTEVLRLDDLPNTGVIEGEGYAKATPDAPVPIRFIFRKESTEGKTTLRIGKVFNGNLSNSEALFHFAACKEIIPPAAVPEQSMIAWQHYRKFRRFKRFTGHPEALGYDSYRRLDNKIIGRLDISDPGFVYMQQYFYPFSALEFAYWSGKVSEITPATFSEKPNCGWLIGDLSTIELYWGNVDPLPANNPRSNPYNNPYWPRRYPRL